MAESSPLAHSPTLVQGSGAGASGGPDDELAAGAEVGEYVVERFLGAGAMGEVYAGVQPVIGKKVAIKVLKREVAATADGAERFKREARAVNQIDHPNVIDVFSFGRLDDGRLYLVMDLVEGRSLRKAITAGPMPLASALDVLGQIADALDAAHAKNVVHRDLKPDNVMLSGAPDSYKAFVLDFGLAKLLTPEGVDPKTSMLTGQGVWLGTPGYMAPEQWSADGAVPASDRYALGVMAFELLAGALPFEAKSLPQMMEQHFRAKVPALSQRGALALPAALDPIVARAMAKDPDARFATAREMVDALRAAAGSKGRRRSAEPPKRAWVPAAIGAGVLALGIGAVLSLRKGDDDTRTEPAVNPAPPTDEAIRVVIDSVPRGATVTRGSVAAATTTPTTLEARDGDTLSFDVSKPGYASAHQEVVVHPGVKVAAIPLALINGFEGVWMLPDGSLRHFHRDGERVTASKLASVEGAREFFRQYDLIPATTGASFSTTENIHEPGRPEHPSCYFPYTTEYHYDPATDHLSVRREHITSDVIEGKCVRKSSKMTEPEELVRADRASSTERDSLAPVGKPTNIDTLTIPNEGKKPQKGKPDVKQIDSGSNQKTSLFEQGKKAVKKAISAKQPPPQQLQREDDLGQNAPNADDNAQAKTVSQRRNNEQQAQLPQQAAPPPNPPPQQKVSPAPQANPPAPAQPRGDSQVAPQVQEQLQKPRQKE